MYIKKYFSLKSIVFLLVAMLVIIFSLNGVTFVSNKRHRHISSKRSSHLQETSQIDVITKAKHLENNIHQLFLTYKQHILNRRKVTPTISPSQRWHQIMKRTNKSYFGRLSSPHNIINTLITPHKCEYKYKLIILVQSYISDFNKRSIIRGTWGEDIIKKENYRWRLLFLVGKPKDWKEFQSLAFEAAFYKDILLINSSKLTEKLQKGFQWASKYCEFDYLLKADDDVFVNIPALFNYLDEPSTPKTELYTGHVMWWSTVARSGEYEANNEYKRDVYPRFCSGTGFVVSVDIVSRFESLFNVVPYLRIEDAQIGELALKSGIDSIDNINFRINDKGCVYNNTFIVIHPVNSKDCMTDMFQKTLSKIMEIGT